MLQFQVPRGKLRTALGRLLPHAGGSAAKQKEADPWGRIRFSLDSHDLLALWTGDNQTRAFATTPVTAYRSPQLDTFDIDAAEVQVILNALQPMGTAEHKSNWLNEDFLITVTDDKVTIAEHWSIHPATKEVTVPRIRYSIDPYPDFPAAILSAATAPQAPIKTFTARQSIIARIVKSKYDHLNLIGLQRQAVLVGGTPEFTAVIPCTTEPGDHLPHWEDIDLSPLCEVLERHLRPPRLATETDDLILKQRLGWETGFEQSMRPVDKTVKISTLTVVKPND